MKLPPNFIICEQGSADWFKVRCGHVTSSRVDDAIRKLKRGGLSLTREHYKMEILEEILTGNTSQHYVSKAMEFGIENEPLARANYEMVKGVEVGLVGFVLHPSIKQAGASPDGLVGDDGLAEFKCPNTTTHLDYVLDGVVPEEYKPQMMWQMACTGRKWNDFVSYDPRLPNGLDLFVVRLERDEKVIIEMEGAVALFLRELNEDLALLRKRETRINPDLTAALQGSLPKAEIPQELPG